MVINMKIEFQYRTTAWDYFRLSLYYMYGSMVGLCNVIFTVAMLLLTVKIWADTSPVIRIVLLLACAAFPVIQPISLYHKARKQANMQKKDMHISFDESGMHITVEGEHADIEWKMIKKISKKPGMIIIFSDTTHGYLITDRMLGVNKTEFYQYIDKKMQYNGRKQ